ncbi:hypothetical protein K502DRAFT_343663 [Neoconidiobolus thromboides FSU 785]|nr:hypothetical protein K502DRAFT_343663 [Neoconidiobolus thromboides FSU 785]
MLKFWLTFFVISLANSTVLYNDTINLDNEVQDYIVKVKTVLDVITQNERKEINPRPKSGYSYSLNPSQILSEKNINNTAEKNGNKTAEPGANVFAQVFQEPGVECKASIKVLDSFIPKLKECYSSTSLYFSTLEKVCSEECLDNTIKSSELISKFCLDPIKDDLKKNDTYYTTKFTSYKHWSNKEFAQLSCAIAEEDKERGIKNRCIEILEKGSNMINNLNATNPTNFLPQDEGKKKELKELICHPCVEKFSNLLTKNSTQFTAKDIPTVYFIALDAREAIFSTYDTICKNSTKY